MPFNVDQELQDQSRDRVGAPRRGPAESTAPELRGYLSLLWRQKWVLLPFLVLTPLVAHYAAGRSAKTYEASSEVFLNRQSANISGIGDPLIFDPARTIRTQAGIARVPTIARRVVDAAKLDLSAGDFLAHSSVQSDPDVDLLTFRVRDEDPRRATTLANLYGEKYIEYRRQLDTKALSDALRVLRPRIDELRRQGLEESGGYSALLDRQQQLQTAVTLQRSNAILVQTAAGAALVTVSSRQAGFLALAAGIIIALALAFLVDAFDSRVRSTDELAEGLGLPVLGGVRESRSRGRRDRLVMLDEPNSASAEMFRILRSAIDAHPALDRRFAAMITSPFAGDDTSATSANLAVAMAGAGRRVVLLDLDLRRPRLEALFGLAPGPGMTDVLLEKARLEDAIVRIPVEYRGRGGSLGTLGEAGIDSLDEYAQQNGSGSPGTLDVIRAGGPLPYTGDFLLTSTLDELFADMRERSDVVLVDGPPLLPSADALTVSSRVDALLLVVRPKTLRRDQVAQVNRVLSVTPAMKLGLVVVGDMGSYAGPGYHSLPARESRRQPVR